MARPMFSYDDSDEEISDDDAVVSTSANEEAEESSDDEELVEGPFNEEEALAEFLNGEFMTGQPLAEEMLAEHINGDNTIEPAPEDENPELPTLDNDAGEQPSTVERWDEAARFLGFHSDSLDEDGRPLYTIQERIRRELPEEHWQRAEELNEGGWDPFEEWQDFQSRMWPYRGLYEPEYGEWVYWDMVGRYDDDYWALPSASRYDRRMQALTRRSDDFTQQFRDRIPILRNALNTLEEVQQRVLTERRAGIPPGTTDQEALWLQRLWDVERALPGQARHESRRREERIVVDYLDWSIRLVIAINALFAFLEEEGSEDGPAQQSPIPRIRRRRNPHNG